MPGSTTRKGLLARFLGGLRYPQVFAILAVLLLLDLFLPDPIPLIDEAVLAILTLLLSMWQKRDPENDIRDKPPMKNVTPKEPWE